MADAHNVNLVDSRHICLPRTSSCKHFNNPANQTRNEIIIKVEEKKDEGVMISNRRLEPMDLLQYNEDNPK